MNTRISSDMKNAEPNRADSAFRFKKLLASLAVGVVTAAHIALRYVLTPQTPTRLGFHWHASQSGLSIEQNFMSVAGKLSSTGAAAGATAAEAEAASVLVAPADTAFS